MTKGGHKTCLGVPEQVFSESVTQKWSPRLQSGVAMLQDCLARMAPKQALRPGEAFLPTVGAFLLTVKLLCLQSLKALIRRTFPL